MFWLVRDHAITLMSKRSLLPNEDLNALPKEKIKDIQSSRIVHLMGGSIEFSNEYRRKVCMLGSKTARNRNEVLNITVEDIKLLDWLSCYTFKVCCCFVSKRIK